LRFLTPNTIIFFVKTHRRDIGPQDTVKKLGGQDSGVRDKYILTNSAPMWRELRKFYVRIMYIYIYIYINPLSEFAYKVTNSGVVLLYILLYIINIYIVCVTWVRMHVHTLAYAHTNNIYR